MLIWIMLSWIILEFLLLVHQDAVKSFKANVKALAEEQYHA